MIKMSPILLPPIRPIPCKSVTLGGGGMLMDGVRYVAKNAAYLNDELHLKQFVFLYQVLNWLLLYLGRLLPMG